MKHHFIPVFYLKRWCGPDGRLCEYSRRDQRPCGVVKPRRTFPDGTGYITDLYALPDLVEARRQRIEKGFFSPADSMAAEALTKMLDGALKTMTGKERSSWSRFMMSLLLRGPDDVAALQKLLSLYMESPAFLEKEYLESRSDDDPATFQEWTEKNRQFVADNGLLVLPRLVDNPRVGERINSMKWGVLTLPQRAHPLLTSDRPIVATTTLHKEEDWILLPINQQKLFVAANSMRTIDSFIRADSRDFGRAINDTVTSFASRFAWGSNDSALSYVQSSFGSRRAPNLLERVMAAKLAKGASQTTAHTVSS